jgi:hypothetical protein
VWLTWFSSAFYLIGGGGTVVASMVYTMISDVVPHAERYASFSPSLRTDLYSACSSTLPEQHIFSGWLPPPSLAR